MQGYGRHSRPELRTGNAQKRVRLPRGPLVLRMSDRRSLSRGTTVCNPVAPERGRLAWLGGVGSWQPRLLACAGLLVALGLTAVFFAGTRYRRSELVESRTLSDNWQRRYGQARQARENLEKQLQGSSDQTGDQQPLMASLEPAPLFFLTATRGAEQSNSPSANRVAVPTTSRWIVLSAEFETDPEFQSYRARLSNPRRPRCLVRGADPPTAFGCDCHQLACPFVEQGRLLAGV
jgi:hypothetical protein